MRVRGAIVALILSAVALGGGALGPVPAAHAAAPPVVTRTERLGISQHGRPITMTVRGRADATIDVLVLGVIHGNERAGEPVVRQLMRRSPPRFVRYWLVPRLNVDGALANTRHNGRGVDLNRNFPFQWRGGGSAWQTYFPGRSRMSERETRIAMRLIRRVRPDLTLWYHQHLRMVIRPTGAKRVRIARTYAGVSKLPLRSYPGGRLFGTAVSWQHAQQPASTALVIELPAGRLGAAGVRRHVRAVHRAALLS